MKPFLFFIVFRESIYRHKKACLCLDKERSFFQVYSGCGVAASSGLSAMFLVLRWYVYRTKTPYYFWLVVGYT